MVNAYILKTAELVSKKNSHTTSSQADSNKYNIFGIPKSNPSSPTQIKGRHKVANALSLITWNHDNCWFGIGNAIGLRNGKVIQAKINLNAKHKHAKK